MFCMQKKEDRVATSAKGSVQAFLYDVENPDGPKRTAAESIKFAKTADQSGIPQYGIKGPSWLLLLPSYRIIMSATIDYMHCVLESVTKQLFELWFDSANRDQEFYCGKQIHKLKKRMQDIRPPDEINRTTRGLKKESKHCKSLRV